MKNSCSYLFLNVFFLLSSTMLLHGMEEEQKNRMQLLLLNGVSCAGKTTLAKAIVKKARAKGIVNIEHLSLDKLFVDSVSDSDYINKQLDYFAQRGIEIFYNLQDNYGKQRTDQFFGVFYQQILERMHKGKLIVADHCFSTEESFLDFLKVFHSFHKNIVLVKVHCDYEIAKQRFHKRNEGNDETQHRQDWCFEQHYKEPKKSIIYENKLYHAELDTSTLTPEEGAEKLMHFFDVSFQQDGTTNVVRKNYEESRSKIDHRYSQSDCLIS